MAPYAYALPGATPADVLSTPTGGTSSTDALSQIAKLLAQKKKDSGGGGGGGGGNNQPGKGTKNIGLKNLPDSMNNSVNENRKLAQAVIDKRYPKWDRKDYRALVQLWNRESGWDPHARNKSSGAWGIPQELNHPVPNSYGHSPLTQILWGLKYIKGRYGDPEDAWQHSQATGWY